MRESPFRNILYYLYSNQDTAAHSYEEREKAWQIFEKKGLPNAKSEQYKYIHNQLTGNIDYTQEINKNVSLPVKEYFYDIDAYHLAIVHGVFSLQDSSLEKSEAYFSINLDSETNINQGFSVSQKFLDKRVDDPFLAINNALYNQDIRITVHEHIAIVKPLIIYFISHDNEAILTHPRVHIEAKENSKSEFIISYHDHRIKPGFINSQNCFYLNKGACIDLVTLQSSKEHKSTILNNTICLQSENSNFNTFTFSTGANIIRNNLLVELNSTNAKTNLYGLTKATGTGFIDNHTTVIHHAEDTQSNELYRNIIDDVATTIFNGEIYVCKDAQKTKAFQTNDSILLSDTATVHTKPQLEIFADDVKCSHGATVGQLNMEEIFYLRSRGIPEEVARTLLIAAFADVVVEKINNSNMKQLVRQFLFPIVSL